MASRILGACADLLDREIEDAQVELMTAIARAGLIAAEGCWASCEPHRDSLVASAIAADACLLAAAELCAMLNTVGRPAVLDAYTEVAP